MKYVCKGVWFIEKHWLSHTLYQLSAFTNQKFGDVRIPILKILTATDEWSEFSKMARALQVPFYFVPSWLTSILHFDIHTWPSFPRYLWCLSVYAIIENKRRVSAGKKVPSRPSLLFRVTSSLNKRTFIILTKPFFLLIVIHRFLLIHGRTCGCGYEGSRLFARYLVRKVTKVTRCWQRWMKCLISSVILHERFPDNSWKLDSLSNLRKYVCSSICH